MAANNQHSEGPSNLLGRHMSPGMSGPQSALDQPNASLGPSARDQARGGRRRSSTFRRAARNVESFSHNRSHRVRRANSDLAILAAHRARTRNLARIEAEQQQQQQQQTQPSEPPEVWKPSIVLGSPLWVEGEDLNAIQLADRKVAQTRRWVEHYKGVPYFTEVHQEALEEREKLDETAEENTTPISALKSTHENAIQQRLGLLRFLLQDSHFPPERENLEAAIAGYQSGAIPYSGSYTLIWAGHIVDRCPDFDSFTTNRRSRLDRYTTQYGPGWLWYEPPLTDGGGIVSAKKGFCLESKAAWRRGTDNMGHYRIRMGFRRRKESVTRGAVPARRIPIIPQPNTSRPGETVPDPDGPRIHWDMLLDSGATLPSLYEADLPKLGISRDRYAAQSARTVNTADSVLYTRVFELDVSILGSHETDEGASSLYSTTTTTTNPEDPNNNNNSDLQPPLSCTIPVLVFTGSSSDLGSSSTTTTGTTTKTNTVPDRLSGLLPFHLCYFSGAPGAFKIWMGPDRRDVLGAGRLPGLARYGEVLNSGVPPPARHLHAMTAAKLARWRSQGGLRTPERVIFEHEIPPDDDSGIGGDGIGGIGGGDGGGVLRDEDVGDGTVLMLGPRSTNFDDPGAHKSKAVQVLRIDRKKLPRPPPPPTKVTAERKRKLQPEPAKSAERAEKTPAVPAAAGAPARKKHPLPGAAEVAERKKKAALEKPAEPAPPAAQPATGATGPGERRVSRSGAPRTPPGRELARKMREANERSRKLRAEQRAKELEEPK